MNSTPSQPTTRRESCRSCYYWEGNREELRATGTCHCEAPRVVGLIQQTNAIGQQQPVPVTVFPVTTSNLWCGDYYNPDEKAYDAVYSPTPQR